MGIRLLLTGVIMLGLATVNFGQTPATPTNFTACDAGTSAISVGIEWSYVSGATTYRIYRSDGSASGPWNQVAQLDNITNSSQTNYVDQANVQPQNQYCYRVEACNGPSGACSAPTYTSCCFTPNMPPPTTYSISGYVTANGSGLAGATVTFQGFQATTNSSGYYILPTVNSGESGPMIAAKTGYTFSSIQISNLSQNLTGQNFGGNSTNPTIYYTITGKAKEGNNTGIPGAIVCFTGTNGSANLSNVTTNSYGNYTRNNVPAGWTGTISATATNYVFTPVSISTPVSGNLYWQNVTAIANSPVISVSPDPLDFGNVQVGSTASLSFNITNNGASPLDVYSIATSAPFTLTGWGVGTIPPGGIQSVPVAFSPTGYTPYSASILINSNSNGGDGIVAVTGTGSATTSGACNFADAQASGDQELINATTYLCQTNGILDNNTNSNYDVDVNRGELAKMAYRSINLGTYARADNWPCPFNDLQDNTVWYYYFAKNLSYLDYQNGVAPFDREYFNFRPGNSISRAHVLKVLLETWDVTINTSGSEPYTDVTPSHDAYNYIRTAYAAGIIDNATLFHPNVNATRGDVFVWLHRIMLQYPQPIPGVDDWFEPGNYTPQNFSAAGTGHSGNFSYSTSSSFAIPSVGMPLSFTHSYNAYMLEMPKEFYNRACPLGVGWTHTYNAYLMDIDGGYGQANMRRVVIYIPNRGLTVWKQNGTLWEPETLGVYDELVQINNSKFVLTTKHQMVYTFETWLGTPSGFPHVLTRVSDRNGNQLTLNYNNGYTVNNQGNPPTLKEVIGTKGRKLQFSYHAGTTLISSVTDPAGRTVYFSYSNDDLSTYTDPKGLVTSYSYSSDPRYPHLLESIQLPKGNTITAGYNQRKLTSISTGNGQVVTFTRNWDYLNGATGYTDAIATDNAGNTTTSNFNSNGMPTNVTGPAGTSSYTWPGTGQQQMLPTDIDINGFDVGYTWDANGNITDLFLPEGVHHHFSYNGLNDVDGYTDPRSKQYSYGYTNGNLTSIIAPGGATTTLTRNSDGTLASVSNPQGITVSYSYDQYGNVIGTSAPLGISTSATYDVLSRIQQFVDPNGNPTSYVFDANDNLQSVTDQFTTSFAYDNNNNLTGITNAEGHTTQLGYTFNEDWLATLVFGSNADQYSYDVDGRMTSRSDPKSQTFIHNYDAEDRLQSISAPGETVTYGYDNKDRVASVANNNGTVQYAYDDLDRLTSTTDYYGNTVSYQYDAASNVTRITYPDGKQVNYTYTDRNELATVTDWNNETTQYTWRNDGALLQTSYPNGTYCLYTYDAAGRMQGLNWHKSNGDAINGYTFTLDPAGNHLDEAPNEPLAQPAWASINLSYSHSATNRLTSAGNVNFYHDANGNMVAREQNGSITATYGWDPWDQLTSVSSANLTASYQYDGAGHRRQAIRNGQETRYVLDLLGMSRVLIETNSSNNAQQYYVYGLGLISRVGPSGTTHYYHSDFRGSTIAMSDASENLTHQYTYGPFGELLDAVEADYNPFRYVGTWGVMYETDELYFMRARYCDPELGRFLSEDPIWGTNLYAYSRNNPVQFVDFTGLAPSLSERNQRVSNRITFLIRSANGNSDQATTDAFNDRKEYWDDVEDGKIKYEEEEALIIRDVEHYFVARTLPESQKEKWIGTFHKYGGDIIAITTYFWWKQWRYHVMGDKEHTSRPTLDGYDWEIRGAIDRRLNPKKQ